jgi:hypothetical protein
MSKARHPSREERRAAALSGTQLAAAQAAGIVFVLRLGGDPYIWLRREVPSVAWGPRDQAMKFRTRDEARAAMARLANYGALALEELAG